MWCLTLYWWGVPLSCLGRWLGVHKTTVLRWMLGLVWALWPTVAGWLRERVRARVVYVDEKWLKIRRQWHYWCVVLDVATGLPICTYLAEHRTEAVCRWLGVQLCLLGYGVKAVVHDGLAAYGALLPEVVHQRCLFHWQQGVTRWVREHLGTGETAEARKQAMKRVVQTSDTRHRPAAAGPPGHAGRGLGDRHVGHADDPAAGAPVAGDGAFPNSHDHQ